MRLKYFDIAKGVGMVLVVISHTFPHGYGIQGFCESFHMPLFFFISGFFFSFSKYTTRDFLKRRFKQLIVPLLTFSLIIGVLNSASQGAWAVSNFILPDTMWFLWVLFLVEVLYYALMRFWGVSLCPLFVILLVSISSQLKHVVGQDPLYLLTIGNALAFYAVGQFFQKRKDELILSTFSGNRNHTLCAISSAGGGIF